MHRLFGPRKNQDYTIELISFLVIVFGLIGICWPSFAQINISKVNRENFILEPQNIFIPSGFDSNDNAQIIINGTLPNPCYKIQEIQTSLNAKKKKLTVKIIGSRKVGDICITVLSEFTEVVNLGKLAPGKYKVKGIGEKTNVSKSFNIAEATSTNQDNFQYAQISKVQVTNTDYQNHVADISIEGIFRESCYTLDEVGVNVTKDHVIEVLPIMKRNSKICQDVIVPFHYTLTTGELKEGKYLVHVRSEKGTSLNKVIDL